jgi:hypothetical protein
MKMIKFTVINNYLNYTEIIFRVSECQRLFVIEKRTFCVLGGNSPANDATSFIYYLISLCGVVNGHGEAKVKLSLYLTN